MLMIWACSRDKEVIEIPQLLLFVAAFFKFQTVKLLFRCFKRFTGCEIPMYITFVAYWVGFPISIYLGLYTDLKAGWDLDRITGRIIFCRFIFVYSLLSIKFVVRNL
jgi:MATE family multidrug resistance protein